METRKKDEDDELELNGYKVVFDEVEKYEEQPKYYVDEEVRKEIESSTNMPSKEIQEEIIENDIEDNDISEIEETDISEIEKAPKKEKEDKPLHKRVSFYVCIIFIISALVFNFNYCITFVAGNSMNPTLHNGELLLATKHTKKLERYDIVLIKTDDKSIIKRIIGLPNETIEYKDDVLYINGQIATDRYAHGHTSDFSVTLGDDEYYCLGDNRENSSDSRFYGAFKSKAIFGKALTGGE